MWIPGSRAAVISRWPGPWILFTVTSTCHAALGIGCDIPGASLITCQVVVFDYAFSVLMNTYRLIFIAVDPVAARGGAAAGFDLYAGQGVGGDLVVFERPRPLVIDQDAARIASRMGLRRSVGLPPVAIATPA